MAGSAWAAPFRPRTWACLLTIPINLGFVKRNVRLHSGALRGWHGHCLSCLRPQPTGTYIGQRYMRRVDTLIPRAPLRQGDVMSLDSGGRKV